MSGSGRSAQRAGTRSRLGTLGVALLPVPLAAQEPRRAPAQRRHPRSRLWLAAVVVALAGAPVGPAHADPVPPRCIGLGDAPGYCIGIEALRVADADHVTATECPVQLRVAEQRLAVAAGDVLVLRRALDTQSTLVVALREQLRAARPWLPGYVWLGIGAVMGVVGSVVLALSL